MQGVLYGLFKDLETAERALSTVIASGIAPEAALLHRQDAPTASTPEERPGTAKPADEPGILAGLFHSLFDSSGEMDTSGHVDTTRQALNRGQYAVSVSAQNPSEMAMAEKVFTDAGAVLQLHPGG